MQGFECCCSTRKIYNSLTSPPSPRSPSDPKMDDAEPVLGAEDAAALVLALLELHSRALPLYLLTLHMQVAVVRRTIICVGCTHLLCAP